MTHSTAQADTPVTPHVPGEPELWIFLLGDMVVFALFFTLWTIGAHQHPEVFAAGGENANRVLGLINTLALLTSSGCAAAGLQRARARRFPAAGNLYMGAAAFGTMFVGIKALEYHQKIRGGADVVGNPFDMYYFVFTGIHLLHVIIGLLVLALVVRRTRAPHRRSSDVPFLEGAGAYWHLVDAFWIVLFLLIYIL